MNVLTLRSFLSGIAKAVLIGTILGVIFTVNIGAGIAAVIAFVVMVITSNNLKLWLMGYCDD